MRGFLAEIAYILFPAAMPAYLNQTPLNMLKLFHIFFSGAESNVRQQLLLGLPSLAS